MIYFLFLMLPIIHPISLLFIALSLLYYGIFSYYYEFEKYYVKFVEKNKK